MRNSEIFAETAVPWECFLRQISVEAANTRRITSLTR